MKRIARLLFCAAFLALVLATPSTALAATPYSTPRVITSLGFEDYESANLLYSPLSVAGEPSKAYWGRSALAFRTGTRSLWCAGTDAITSRPGTYTSYPPYTRGLVTTDLPQLADYYSSVVSLWYVLPSRGSAGDAFGISIARVDNSGNLDFSSPTVNDPDVADAASWTLKSYTLGAGSTAGMSRKHVRFGARFFDSIESSPTGRVGQGAFIDDFSVSGYKFGPVRGIEATWSAEASGVVLSWAAPQRSAIETAEDTRTMVYRAWRSEAGTDTWVEVGPVEPRSECSLTDTSVADLALYDYVVQAWDPGDGVSYGVQSAKVRVVTPKAVDAIGKDEDPPSTVASAPAGWVRPPAIVTLTSTDTVSGVDSIYYSLDGSEPSVTYDGPLAISTQGHTLVRFRAMDRFGNMEPIHEQSVYVDGRAPESTASVESTLGSGLVTLSAEDNGIGSIAGSWFRLDGASEQSGTAIPVGPGEHTVLYRSADTLGNLEDWKSLSFSIPYSCSIEMTSSAATVTYPTTVTLRGRLTDASSTAVVGKKLMVEYSYDASSWATLATATPSGTGYVLSTRPSRPTYYRLVLPEFAADALYPSVTGSPVRVDVLAYMGTPSASVSTTTRYRTIRISSLVRPKHATGLKFRFFRLEGSHWVLRKTVTPRYSTYNSTTTRIYCSTSLSLRGKWRVRAYHAPDVHAARYSSYRSILVK